MALATKPAVNGMIRPVCKRRLEKPAVVIMEDTCPSTCTYHKQCLSILMDIYEKGATKSNEIYDCKIRKIAELVTSENDSDSVFRTFCGVSFLDRYQDHGIIASAMQDMDKRISNSSWRIEAKLEARCVQLLTRMSTIENLSSIDADFICLVCHLCKLSNQYTVLFDLLLEIGRSVWPYLKRPLWNREPFVDLVVDIFETIGNRLEELYPKNFCIAWKIILENVIALDRSCYSRLRLLALIERRHKKWTLPIDLAFYREEIEAAVLMRKKEILSFLGLLSSKRKTSLTVKPGRSAADFLKRRQSSENQDIEERCSTSSGDGSEALNEVFEEDFNENERVFSPKHSKNSFGNKSLSNTESKSNGHENATNGYHMENMENNIRTNARETLFETKNHSVEDSKEPVCVTESTKQDLCQTKQTVCAREQKEFVVEKLNENPDQEVNEENEARDEEIEVEKIPNGSGVPNDTGNNYGNICQESGSTWQENENGEKLNELWEDTGNRWQEIEDVWQESDNAWKEDETIWKDTQCTDDKISSFRNDHRASDETNINVPEHRSFLFERRKELVKVHEKYVGRVIGAQGSRIASIQEESGARVHIIRQQKDKVVPARPAFSTSTIKNIVHNTLGIPNDKTSTAGKSSSLDEDDTNRTTKDQEEFQEDQEIQEEFEFEIIGSNESIEKAKQKIESIISHAKRLDNYASLKRHFSEGDDFNRFFRSRKKVIMKVADKYVGRVIGTGGSMIMTIEEESGAKVTFLKDRRTERPIQQESIGSEKECELQNELVKDGEQDERKELEETVESQSETVRDENMEESKEVTEEEKFQGEQKGEESGMCREERQDGGDLFLHEKGYVACENAMNTKVERKTNDEFNFEISGTDEQIEKATKKIEYIMKLVDNGEKKPFTRSLSCSTSRRGFKQFQRSLSCPIVDWGASCTGECTSCQKRSYCRSFLLEKSESPSCWIRPEVLALTQDADWAEFIVKTKVDDRALWRPRKSSNASINSGSGDDICSDCTSPRDSAKSTFDSTHDNPESSSFGCKNILDLGSNGTTDDTATQINGDVISTNYN